MRAFILIVFLAGAVATTTSAQLSLGWWTVNGGGGTSTSADGRCALSGTAGQPDAGSMAGGNILLQGGFWSGFLPAPPRLWIVRLPSGALEVSWPAWARDFRLEQAPTLSGSPGQWNAVSPASYQADGTRFYVTLSPSADMRFYRLRQVCLGP